jgi:hypothetical protein
MVDTSLMFVVQRAVAAAPALIRTRAGRERFQHVRIGCRLACIGSPALRG